MKKEKKKKKKKRAHSSSSSDEERITKRNKKKKDFTDTETSSESSEQSENEWVEKSLVPKQPEKPLPREDWMSGMLIPTYSKPEKPDIKNTDKQKHIDSYDPSKSVRELNPYWKNGGGGLPTFQRPNVDEDRYDDVDKRHQAHYSKTRHDSSKLRQSSWRKTETTVAPRKSRSPSPRREEKHRKRRNSSSSSSSDAARSPTKDSIPVSSSQPTISTSDFLTDQQMNELGAKIVKAEIMGNSDLAKELQEKLNRAREYRATHKQEVLSKTFERRAGTERRDKDKEAEDILLTTTNSKGVSRPVNVENDLWGGRAGKKAKKSKPVETHAFGERVRYFADDDKYDIKQMVRETIFISFCFCFILTSFLQFEKEKFATAADQDMEFANIAGSHKNPNDDLEDIFAEKVRKQLDDRDINKKERDRAIHEHQQMNRTLESCKKCFDSPKLDKQLIISMGKSAYIALPWHEGLTNGHCIITTLAHVSCTTQLDEDVWAEIRDFMKAITQMFETKKEDVIFFEIARNLPRRPHLEIHCVASRDFEMAPFYFKKAIQESEREWSTNKQLIDMKTGDVRRAIPKGLPYFWVTFGADRGFAHVIEEQDRFPANFAQVSGIAFWNILLCQIQEYPRYLSTCLMLS